MLENRTKIKKQWLIALVLSGVYSFSESSMASSIFRKYDIRGRIGSEVEITDFYPITQAIAYYCQRLVPKLQTVAVGMDGRLHSPAIKNQICAALLDAGLNVIFIGVCPSPALYLATQQLEVELGLMITASHNPKDYNGLKIILKGQPVWNEQLLEIRDLYLNQVGLKRKIKGLYSAVDGCAAYVSDLVQRFTHLKNQPIRGIVDCGNGAAGTVMPQLLKALGWSQIQLLYPVVDGHFPHHIADPSQLDNLQALQRLILADPKLQFGAGLDGDADRVGIMTTSGKLLAGDQLLTIFAEQIAHYTPQLKVICDVKFSAALKKYLQDQHITIYMTPCGNAYIKKAMSDQGALVGGELSGHFCFKDRHPGFDDGIYALLRWCEILIQTGMNADQLLAKLPPTIATSEIRLACRAADKEKIVDHTKAILARRTNLVVITIDGIRTESNDGWGSLRCSNTEDVLSIKFEGYSAAGLQRVKADYIEILQEFFPAELLATELK